ncbi:hypothetical protein ACFSUJ_34680 [Streptomyces lusitanus]|uniref:hypothetical protein n=1 Tax=Streptomyces lusitanus TaxID=68232 RepID=UPI0036300266
MPPPPSRPPGLRPGAVRRRAGRAGRLTGPADRLDALRLAPPVFMEQRLAKLIELGREPTYQDVDLRTTIGGLRSTAPVYLSALGSTRAPPATSARRSAARPGRSASRW